MRSLGFRRLGASLFALGLLAAAGRAQAAGLCDPNALTCATGTAKLHAEGTDTLTTSLDTGWIPSCGSSDHCTSKPVQVRADIAMPVVNAATPLYVVDMPKGAVVVATWDNQYITLTTDSGAQSDGTFSVHHSLQPDVSLYVGIFGFTYTYNLDATQLLNRYSPGASFSYDGQGTVKFAPWGFGGAQALVNAPDLDSSRLFEMDLNGLPAIGQDLDGTLSVNAVTRPTFEFKTTSVALVGADVPITATGGSARLPTADGDFLEIQAAVQGEISGKGELQILPAVHITRVLDHDNLDLDLSVNVGLNVSYEVQPHKVTFPAQIIHIPLPNVHVPQGFDVGSARSGGTTSRSVSIENSGELAARMSFTSDDPQFEVPDGDVVVPPKSTYDLKVGFHPSSDGPMTAKITVHSTDPDSPDQVLAVAANGAHVPGEEGEPDASAAQAGGCGCKVAGPASSGGLAGLGGLAALGLAAAVRRRRRR